MSKQSGNVILGTLVGAAMGFAAGILLAPAKGSETRDILGDKATDLKGTLNEATDKAMASLKELKESAERTLRGQKEDAETVGLRARAKANETASAIKNA